MYLNRKFEGHPTDTAPGISIHRSYELSTFFHNLSCAIAEEIKLQLWVQDYDSPGKMAKWLETIMESPMNETTRTPLVLEFKEGKHINSPHTITYTIDHHRIERGTIKP